MHGRGDHARPGRLMRVRGDQYVVHGHGDQYTAREIDAQPRRLIHISMKFDVKPWRLISGYMFVFVLAISFSMFGGSMDDIFCLISK